MKRVVKAALVFPLCAVCASLSGCLVVSYSSQGGWWVWPGSLVVTLVLLLVWVLSRR